MINAAEIIFALAIPAIIGFIYINNIKKEYKMENEKRRSGNYTLSYRADSAFAFATSTDELISHHVTRTPIVNNRNNSLGSGMGPGGISGRGRHF